MKPGNKKPPKKCAALAHLPEDTDGWHCIIENFPADEAVVKFNVYCDDG